MGTPWYGVIEFFERRQQTPERELLFAIVERALCDLDHPERHIRADAENWLLSTATGVRSFQWCLDELGLLQVHSEIIRQIKASKLFKRQRLRRG